MRLTFKICVLPLVAGLLAAFACSEGTETPPGTGESAGTGNTPNTAAAATGGAAATTPSSGGAEATTTPGQAGAGATTTPETGTGGAATTTGTSTSKFTKCWDFAEGAEGWKKVYAIVPSATDPATRDETLSADLLNNTAADWMATEGFGGLAGHIRLNIPFNAVQNQFQGLTYGNIFNTAPVSLVGNTISAQVKLVSGMQAAGDSSHPAGAKIAVKSGADWYYAAGPWQNLSQGEWMEVYLNIDSPDGIDGSKDKALWDPTQIVEIDLEFDTSGSATAAMPGVVLLDHVCYGPTKKP